VSTFGVLINIAFGLIATGKAIFGSAWSYPLAPDFISFLEAKTDGSVAWRAILVGYAATVPITFAYLFWTGIAGESESGLVFAIGFVLVVFLLIASIITPVVLIRDARANAESDVSSMMSWLPYVGSPLAFAALTYILTALQFGSGNPFGDAIYAFAGTFWLATVVYLIRQY